MRSATTLIVLTAVLAFAADGLGSPRSAVTTSTVRRDARPLPAAAPQVAPHFEVNAGQVDPRAQFLARCRGYHAFLTSSGAAFTFSVGDGVGPSETATKGALNMRFVGAAAVRGEGRLTTGGVSHYLIGNDPAAWIRDVPHVRRVRGNELYTGVDVEWRGTRDGALRYDLHVRPGGDPDSIEIAFDGATGLEIDASGVLLVSTPLGVQRHSAPRLFQRCGAETRPVSGRFALRESDRVGFEVGEYDRTQTLVIDPEVKFSTYMGDISVDVAWDIAVSDDHEAHVTGSTRSPSFPTKSAYQGSLSGGIGGWDAFVAKFNAKGDALEYSTFLGGGGRDEGMGIALDSKGAAVVAGLTASKDFPTKSARQSTWGGGTQDVFVTKFTTSGSALTFSTYHGGSGDDAVTLGNCIALDGNDAVYVAGHTHSTNFPTASPIQATKKSASNNADLFVSKFASTGATLTYSTYYGGTGGQGFARIAVDSKGAAYVCATTTSKDFPLKSAIDSTYGGGNNSGDGIVMKLNAAGSAATYATFLGGSGNDWPNGIAVDSDGAAYVAGWTDSTNFPTKSAFQSTHGGGTEDGFVTKLNAAGSAWDFSTYLGHTGRDECHAIAVDTDEDVYVTGFSDSSGFPIKNALQDGDTLAGGVDVFVTQLESTGDALVQSTFIGGSGLDGGWGIAVETGGTIYVTGYTESSNYPTENAVQSTMVGVVADVIVTKIGAPRAPLDPDGLTAIARSDVLVELLWNDNAVEETTYEVERAPSGGAFARIAVLGADAESFDDTSVSGESAYDYRVRAVNSTGPSKYTTVATVTTGPHVPTDLVAAVQSNTSIELTWSDESSTETSFDVQRRNVSATGDWSTVAIPAADSTAFTDVSAAPETSYVYRVRAVGATAPSRWSAEASGTTPPADPLAKDPTAATDVRVMLAWTDDSLAEDGYELQRGAGCPPAQWLPLALLGPDIAQHLDDTAQPETTYSYRVRAFNADGNSEWVLLGCITTPSWAPDQLSGSPLSPSRVRVTWRDLASSEDGFKIRRADDSDSVFWDLVTLPADTQEFLDLTASQERAYIYRIASFNQHGTSGWTEISDVATPALLILRKAKIKRAKAAAKKSKPSSLSMAGEFDIGGAGIHLAGAATLGIGDGAVAIGGFDPKGKGLRYQDDNVRLDLKPGKGSSRVSFKLTASGALVDALDPEGEMTLSFENGDYRAMGTVGLSGDKFQPGKQGAWIDPAFNLTSLRAKLKGAKGALTIKAAFHTEDGIPDDAPEVVVKLGFFTFTANADQFTQKGEKWLFSQKALGSRKITLDYKKGQVTIALKGVDLGAYEKGSVPVRVSVDFADVHFEDTPEMSSSGKSLKY